MKSQHCYLNLVSKQVNLKISKLTVKICYIGNWWQIQLYSKSKIDRKVCNTWILWHARVNRILPDSFSGRQSYHSCIMKSMLAVEHCNSYMPICNKTCSEFLMPLENTWYKDSCFSWWTYKSIRKIRKTCLDYSWNYNSFFLKCYIFTIFTNFQVSRSLILQYFFVIEASSFFCFVVTLWTVCTSDTSNSISYLQQGGQNSSQYLC